MEEQKFQFSYSLVKDVSDLNKSDEALLETARKTTKKSYAPYSNFHVACAAKLANGNVVLGTNQENASFPVGICAERAMLATIGTQYLNEPIETLAIAYHALNGNSDTPISPCGMCRQALAEYEARTKKQMRVILSGMTGRVYVINSVKDLLPLAFGSDDLAKG